MLTTRLPSTSVTTRQEPNAIVPNKFVPDRNNVQFERPAFGQSRAGAASIYSQKAYSPVGAQATALYGDLYQPNVNVAQIAQRVPGLILQNQIARQLGVLTGSNLVAKPASSSTGTQTGMGSSGVPTGSGAPPHPPSAPGNGSGGGSYGDGGDNATVSVPSFENSDTTTEAKVPDVTEEKKGVLRRIGDYLAESLQIHNGTNGLDLSVQDVDLLGISEGASHISFNSGKVDEGYFKEGELFFDAEDEEAGDYGNYAELSEDMRKRTDNVFKEVSQMNETLGKSPKRPEMQEIIKGKLNPFRGKGGVVTPGIYSPFNNGPMPNYEPVGLQSQKGGSVGLLSQKGSKVSEAPSSKIISVIDHIAENGVESIASLTKQELKKAASQISGDKTDEFTDYTKKQLTEKLKAWFTRNPGNSVTASEPIAKMDWSSRRNSEVSAKSEGSHPSVVVQAMHPHGGTNAMVSTEDLRDSLTEIQLQELDKLTAENDLRDRVRALPDYVYGKDFEESLGPYWVKSPLVKQKLAEFYPHMKASKLEWIGYLKSAGFTNDQLRAYGFLPPLAPSNSSAERAAAEIEAIQRRATGNIYGRPEGSVPSPIPSNYDVDMGMKSRRSSTSSYQPSVASERVATRRSPPNTRRQSQVKFTPYESSENPTPSTSSSKFSDYKPPKAVRKKNLGKSSMTTRSKKK